MRTAILPLLVLSWTVSAPAEISNGCAVWLRAKGAGQNVIIAPVVAPLNEAEAEKVHGELGKLQAQFGNLATPDYVWIRLAREGTAAQFDTNSWELVVTMDLSSTTGPVGAACSAAVRAREYGLQVFDENLGRYSSAMDLWVSKSRVAASFHRTTVQPEMAKLDEREKSEWLVAMYQPDALESAEAETAAVRARVDQLSVQCEELRGKPPLVVAIAAPYRALFGEVVATLESKKASKQVSRDTTLTPAYVYLMEHVLNRSESATHSGLAVSRLFEVIAKEIVTRETNRDLQTLTPQTMNDRLIAALKTEFSKP